MEITCSSCNAKFSVPDERLPQNRVFQIPCPRCKAAITVSTKKDEGEKAEVPAPSRAAQVVAGTDDGGEAPTEAFDENARPALICESVSQNQTILRSSLMELGYNVHVAANADDALNKIKFNQYEVIVLNEEFAGSTPEDNAVLHTIHPMPMTVRRYIFVVLLGKKFRTLDNMMAFAKSVNVVINISDLPNIKGILRRSIADNDQFYKVFKEALREAGRR